LGSVRSVATSDPPLEGSPIALRAVGAGPAVSRGASSVQPIAAAAKIPRSAARSHRRLVTILPFRPTRWPLD
jgi:hypothetical protein